MSTSVARPELRSDFGSLAIANANAFAKHAAMSGIPVNARVAHWFGSELEDVGGRVLTFEARLEYRLFEHVGIGAGYRYMDVEIEADSQGLHGEFGYKLSMPTTFVRVDF